MFRSVGVPSMSRSIFKCCCLFHHGYVEDKGDLVENDPTFHSDVDKELMDKLPWEAGRRP